MFSIMVAHLYFNDESIVSSQVNNLKNKYSNIAALAVLISVNMNCRDGNALPSVLVSRLSVVLTGLVVVFIVVATITFIA